LLHLKPIIPRQDFEQATGFREILEKIQLDFKKAI